ncbi:hypothetical protein ACHAXT_006282 [Thalassiosira profunda]
MSESASPKVPQKTSRKSEIALLEQISTSLDAVIGDRPLKKSRTSASDANKTAAKNFLATKTLVKNIAKACAQEGKSDALVELLVEEYKEGFPTLTKQMLVDAIAKMQDGDASAEEEDDELPELKLGRIVATVDAEMTAYHEKIEALKRAREVAANAPEPEKPGKKKRKSKGAASPKDPNAPKRGRGRPKGSTPKVKNTPENFLINEIVKRYAVEKSKCDRLPNGALEVIVEETKRAHQMESFDMDLKVLDKKVRFRYNKLVEKNEVDVSENKYKFLVEEVYARYSRTKSSTGASKLPPGTLDSIIEAVKLEYGLTEQDIKLNSLKQMVTARYRKDNPEFQSTSPGQVKIAKLSEEAAQRRQLLFNEITARYVREKEANPKKLADGTLDRIIEQTKVDLDIKEFSVPKASIRGRINRKSYHVQTLGSDSPANSIDAPLVATINSWLSQGISVTRAQGLELANGLLKGKKLKTSTGQEIQLDAKWWRSFLERNRRKLVCAGND